MSMHWPLTEIAQACGASVGGAQPAQLIHSVSIDTRTLSPGALFVALPGERVDGHDLLAQASAAGANAAVVQRPIANPIAQILVPDTQLALGQIARAWREKMPAKRLALTGSNGKTTVKNLLHSILSQRANTLATAGNYNNELGLPLTLLALRAEHEFAVLEMGAGKPGDIAYLAELGAPSISLVNNAMAAHLQRLGSIRGVAEEKAAIYRALPASGLAVINADDPHRAVFDAAAAHTRRCYFSLAQPSADFYASHVQLGERCRFQLHSPVGQIPVDLPLLGAHNVSNALAAAAMAFGAGADLEQIAAGLHAVEAGPGRLQLQPQPAGWNLLNDSYNANPGSLLAGMRALCALPGSAWVVLGNMAELGDDAMALHREIGVQARELGVAQLWCHGELAGVAADAAGTIGRRFDSLEQLAEALRASLHAGINVLLKGSRSARMERVLALLTPQATGGTH